MHRITPADVLDGNRDLVARAARILRRQRGRAYALEPGPLAARGDGRVLPVRVGGRVDRIDAFLDGRPQGWVAVERPGTVPIDGVSGGPEVLDLLARRAEALVAARKVRLAPPG